MIHLVLGLAGVIPVSSSWERDPSTLQKRPNILVKMIHKISSVPKYHMKAESAKFGLKKSNSTGLQLSIFIFSMRHQNCKHVTYRSAIELAPGSERLYTDSSVPQSFEKKAEGLFLLGITRDMTDATWVALLLIASKAHASQGIIICDSIKSLFD